MYAYIFDSFLQDRKYHEGHDVDGQGGAIHKVLVVDKISYDASETEQDRNSYFSCSFFDHGEGR